MSGATTIRHGGPLAGIGVALESPELRTRVGYEMGFREAWLASASVETAFRGRVTVSPVIEGATPDLAIVIPSLGLGLGTPLRFATGRPAEVGVRLQLSLSFPLLSLVIPIDAFPGARDGEHVQTSLFGQLSF